MLESYRQRGTRREQSPSSQLFKASLECEGQTGTPFFVLWALVRLISLHASGTKRVFVLNPCSPSKHKVQWHRCCFTQHPLFYSRSDFPSGSKIILYWGTDGGTVEKLVEQTNVFYLLCLKLSLTESWYCAGIVLWEELPGKCSSNGSYWVFPNISTLYETNLLQFFFYLDILLCILREGNAMKEYNCSKERDILPAIVNKSTDNTRKWEIQVCLIWCKDRMLKCQMNVAATGQLEFVAWDLCLIYILNLRNISWRSWISTESFHLVKNRPTCGLQTLLTDHGKIAGKKKVVWTQITFTTLKLHHFS